MKSTKLAASLAVAGLLLAAVGLFGSDSESNAQAVEPAALAGVDSLDPITGLAPIEDVIALFAARSNERPTDYLSRTQLGQALHTQAREKADLEGYEAAQAVLEEALDINPQWQPAQLALAGALHAQHRFAEAHDIAQRLVDQDPSSLGALALLGDATLELGQLDEAQVLYDQLAAAERSAPVVSRLARIAALRGDHPESITLAEEALDLAQDLALRPNTRAFYWFQLGRFQFDAGQVTPAMSTYGRALEIDPGNAGATESLAFAASSIGDFSQAAMHYEALIATGPAPDLHGSYADVLTALGRFDEAATQERLGMELALATMDRFPAERRHLVDFFLTRDSSIAVDLARADFEDRQDWGAFDTLAWALYVDGQIAEAAAVYALAPPGDAPQASMRYHQAEVLAAIGRGDDALQLAESALALNPFFDPAEADAARSLVAELSAA